MRVVNLDWYGEDEGGADFTSAGRVYSLRKYFSWSNAVLKIRRSSDNATAFVFFDGATSQDAITTSSYISTTSNTTPDATTLSTWLSTDNAFVEQWIAQRDLGTIESSAIISQATTTKQPKFATSGVIETTNGKAGLLFDGSNDVLFNATVDTSLNDTNEFTIIYVANHLTSDGIGTVFSSNAAGSNLLVLFIDRRTAKNIGGNSPYRPELITQQNISDQFLINFARDSTNNIGYYNGVLQDTVAHTSASYTNADFYIGAFNSASAVPLNGYIQEFIVFPSDKTADLAGLNDDINAYYSIY